MATWSAVPFGSDTALEFFHTLEPLEPADVPAALREALLDVTGNEGYLDLVNANRGIGAAAIVASLTADPEDAGIDDDDVIEWLASTDLDLPDDLILWLTDALDRVVDEDSEWVDTWSLTNDQREAARDAVEKIRSFWGGTVGVRPQ